MDVKPLETLEGHGVPTIRQQSVFIENRVGQLLRLTKMFDQSDIRILAVSVVYSVDCAIVRMVLDEPDEGQKVLRDHDFQVSETEVIAVSLPHGKRALLHTWAALLGGEVNIHYVYPLLVRPKGHAAMVVCCDNAEQGIQVLRDKKFDVLDQQDLLESRNE